MDFVIPSSQNVRVSSVDKLTGSTNDSSLGSVFPSHGSQVSVSSQNSETTFSPPTTTTLLHVLHHAQLEVILPFESATSFRSLVGALQYPTFTRPDLSYVVGVAC